MRLAAFAALLVLAGGVALHAVPASAQGAATAARFELLFELNTGAGEVDVRLRVAEPGPLQELELLLGDVRTLQGEPTFDGDWTWQDGSAVADLKASPNAVIRWTAGARILVESLEGKGHTSYVGPELAMLKPGDLMPGVRYKYVGEEPSLTTTLTGAAPSGWSVRAPWERNDAGQFRFEGLLPRGFIAASEELTEDVIGQGAKAYRVVRLAGSAADPATPALVTTAETYLGGLYGTEPKNRFIVVAPDPMFRGGLGSPAGIFLHAEADASVVAHELVHVYQAWQVSREPGNALVWLVEGSAVVHGALLEAAAGVRTRDEVVAAMEAQERLAQEKHAADLTTAVYGSGNEPAAYSKGAVVVTALNDQLRSSTGEEYTLSDVLREVNARHGDGRDNTPLTSAAFLEIIGDVTGFDLDPFFARYVRGTDVPALGVLFPGEASVRALGTDPSPAIALEPLDLRVAVNNLDVEPVTLDVPVLVNGTEAGRLVATVAAGASAEARAALTPLPRGLYSVQVEGSNIEVRVVAPASATTNLTLWPTDPTTRTQATVGIQVANAGEAPYQATLTLAVDGTAIASPTVDVAGGASTTVPVDLPPLAPGEHRVQLRGPDGAVLAALTFTMREHAPLDAPLAPLLALVGLAVAGIVRRRA